VAEASLRVDMRDKVKVGLTVMIEFGERDEKG
jgi:hypothetical protein